MEQQHYCFLYDGSEEQEVAFEVWDGIAEPKNAGDDGTNEGWYLFDNGDMSTLNLINSTILSHTSWLNRIRPLQVGDVVEHITEGKGVIKRIEDDEGSVLCLVEFGSYFLKAIPSSLRLISRAEKPTEWQPKWGEEVEVSYGAVCWHKTIFGCLSPSESDFKYLTTSGAFRYIRPITKPKTLREDINDIAKDWLLSENQYDLADRIINLIKERGIDNA
jgi:hypothetical protein